jgi:site-specific recombinase XerD
MPINSSAAHITAQSLMVPTINAWKIYLVDQGNSIHTVKAFAHDLKLLASYLSSDKTVGSIATTDLNNFLDWLQSGRGVSCSPKSLARRITSIKAFFRWLIKYGAISIDPAERVLQKSVISPLPVVLTKEEVERLLDTAETYRIKTKPDARYLALFSLLIYSGIKKSETLNLTTNHIELDAKEGPMIFIRYASPQNRYRERKIFLPEHWADCYLEYQTQYNIKDHLFPWSQRRLEYLLEDLSKETGLEKHLSFDMCRWTCALMDWQSGIEKDHIRQKLGISKVQWREVSMKLRRLAG